MRHRPGLLSIVAALALTAAACGGAADDPTIDPGGDGGGGTIEIGGEQANDRGTVTVGDQDVLGMNLGDNYFEPTVVEGEAGQTLTLEASNEGQAPHTFTIDGTDIDEELQPGDTATIEVTFPDSGALIFHCHFHDSQGMRGALSVGGSLEVSNAGNHDSGEHEDTEGGPAEEEEDGEGKY